MTRPAHRTVSRDGFVHLEYDNVSSRFYRTVIQLILRLAYDFSGIRVTRDSFVCRERTCKTGSSIKQFNILVSFIIADLFNVSVKLTSRILRKEK
jgi:hypothetical protein